jgi:hypothetical protein
MTIDLDAIKARLAAACPGPWTGMTVRRAIDGNCLAIVREHPDGEHESMKGSTLTIAATLLPQYGDNDTAVMLLHSRADMDALVAEVERLRGVNADLRLMVDGLETAAHEERAAVVAWLRDEATKPFEGAVALFYAAKRIERGEHRRKEGA